MIQHRNDLRFYKREQLIELALILGIPHHPGLDLERLKDAIVAGCRKLPPYMQAAHQKKQLDTFLASFR